MTMKPTSAQKIMAYRDRQLLLGRRKREAYLTDDEWVKVKQYIKSIKECE
jgi:hypothetical protein